MLFTLEQMDKEIRRRFSLLTPEQKAYRQELYSIIRELLTYAKVIKYGDTIDDKVHCSCTYFLFVLEDPEFTIPLNPKERPFLRDRVNNGQPMFGRGAKVKEVEK
jgi:hypothetical protein